MYSRRSVLRLGISGLIVALGAAGHAKSQPAAQPQIWLPMVLTPPEPAPVTAIEPTPHPTVEPTAAPILEPTPAPITEPPPGADDAPLLGPASGSVAHAINWLVARSNSYTAYDIDLIVNAYRSLGEQAEIDWFLAIAQCAHETGSLTSWWCQRPRRNPAGLGVTGRVMVGPADQSPGPGWSWDGSQWREGLSFASWVDHAIPAHLGRLLAYALRDEQCTPLQRELVNLALSLRPLPASYRGSAPTISGLNGRWAYPGTDYGQRIVDLARRMAG